MCFKLLLFRSAKSLQSNKKYPEYYSIQDIFIDYLTFGPFTDGLRLCSALLLCVWSRHPSM